MSKDEKPPEPPKAAEPAKPPMQIGSVAYFTEAGLGSNKRKNRPVKFKGTAFGILLGIVPPFKKDPDAGMIGRLLGQVGLVLFDDVAEFLGDDAGAECVRQFENKYYSAASPDNGGAVVMDLGATETKDAPKLLNAHGVPVASTDERVIVGLDGKPVS